jgi:Tfp pilus assembly protein PilO
MMDKTPLERDIENREMAGTPGIIKLLILILSAGLVVVTLYTFFLKQELERKDQKIIILQEEFQNEKTLLLGEIKELRTRLNVDIKDENQDSR